MGDESKPTLQQLEEDVQRAATDREKLDALTALITRIQETDPQRGRALCEDAAALATALDDARSRARVLILWGRCHCNLGAAHDGAACLTESLAISRRIGDRSLEAAGLCGLGFAARGLADYPAALEHYQTALALYWDLDEPNARAEASDGTGMCYYRLGDLSQALLYSIEALKVRREMGDQPALARSLNNLGGLYDEMGDPETAIRYFKECLQVARETGSSGPHVYSLNNLAKSCSKLGRHDEALAAAETAVGVARRAGYQVHECRALMAWGEARHAAGCSAEAVPLYREALELALALSNLNCEVEARCLIGAASLSAGDLTEAGASYARAIEIAEERGFKQFAQEAHRGLSSVFERMGAYADALIHYRKYHALEQEIFSEAADKRAKALMIQMQVESAQKEAELQRQTALLHRQEAELHRLKSVELAQANETLRTQAVLLQEQAEELHAQARELEMQARRDGLTNIANRRHLEDALSRQFAASRRYRTPLTVVLADVDHFKQVNDRFGHQVGDAVLKKVAALLQAACRAADLAARYGGEEFALTLPETSLPDGLALCERVRCAVMDHPWEQIAPGLSVTISLGASDDPDAVSFERLLALADHQLYEAKRAGRNRAHPVLAVHPSMAA